MNVSLEILLAADQRDWRLAASCSLVCQWWSTGNVSPRGPVFSYRTLTAGCLLTSVSTPSLRPSRFRRAIPCHCDAILFILTSLFVSVVYCRLYRRSCPGATTDLRVDCRASENVSFQTFVFTSTSRFFPLLSGLIVPLKSVWFCFLRLCGDNS